MSTVPKIASDMDEDDFHDSSLLDLHISPQLDVIRVVVSTPDRDGVERLWMVTFRGVLRFEFETVGDGSTSGPRVPLEIYSIYSASESAERKRWVQRLIGVGVSRHDAEAVRHVVLASSFARGWGTREELEGLQIICRDVHVERAPADYHGSEFRRPRIEADE